MILHQSIALAVVALFAQGVNCAYAGRPVSSMYSEEYSAGGENANDMDTYMETAFRP